MFKPATPEAYKLFHDGVVALANVEQNGIRIDTEYLANEISRTERRIAKGEEWLKKSDVWRYWRRKFYHKAKLLSLIHISEPTRPY